MNKTIKYFVNQADDLVSQVPFNGKKITYGLSPECDFPADIYHERNGTLTLILDTNVIPTNSKNLSFLKNCIMPLIKSNKLNANKKYNR